MKPSFDLGARIAFTHRSAVARKDKTATTWNLVEGIGKREGFLNDPAANFQHPDSRVNKAIITWESEGTGTVIGLVKKGVGESVSSSGSTSMFEDNFDPGFFNAKEWVMLYAVKQGLPGLEYIFVLPEHARLA